MLVTLLSEAVSSIIVTSIIEEGEFMDTDQLKLIDFEKDEDRYHKVKLYFGNKECKDYWGDDWKDTPYEHNAGPVYDEFVECEEGVTLKNGIILQPSDIPDPNSGWCKRDFKKRTTPCLLVVPEEVVLEYENRFGDYPTYTQAIGHPRVRRIYYGDRYPQIMNDIKNTEINRKPRKYLEAVPHDEIREIPLWLLEDIQQYITFTTGLYCTDNGNIVKKIEKNSWFQLNETKLNEQILEYL